MHPDLSPTESGPAAASSENPVPARLQALRAAMGRHGVKGVLVPSSDPHLSEYLPAYWQGRAWASGFTGSSGLLVVLADEAALFTDSRYWTQAEQELAGSGIALEKVQAQPQIHLDWLAERLSAGQVLAVDGRALGLSAAAALRQRFEGTGIVLRTDLDLLGEVWADRPGLGQAPVFEHRPPHACVPRTDKLRALRGALGGREASHHLVSSLDDIAWLLNLRGQDVDYNPVFIAHALVGPERATLFADPAKFDAELRARLAADGIDLADYEQAAPALAALPADARLWVDPKRVTVALREAVAEGVEIVEATNPSVPLKSRKTDGEAAHIREAMARDAAAMARFYAWFEQALGRETITELTVDERLSEERARETDFVSLSFPTIAGFNANGAMPHYRALPQSHATLSTPQGLAAQGLLLIDSGAQYLGGTTDITRVWAIGTPTAAQRRDFTLVLKAMIGLSRARFPVGTLSPMIDALARAPLWAEGLDYGHGTGHGVGYFLNVHEGPQSISKAVPDAGMAMHKGMVTSNEPAVYRPGQWGVRIENLLLTVDSPAREMGDFLAFETLTLCPIDARCIEVALLRQDEIAWLDAYHAQVRERVAPRLQGEARAWLEHRTRPLAG